MAYPSPGGVYHIVSRNAPNLVLGVSGGDNHKEAKTILWRPDGTPNQAWRIENQNGLWAFVPMHAVDKRLDANNGCNELPVWIWDRTDGNNPNQLFRLEPTDSGFFCIRRNTDGAALDVFQNRNDQGAELRCWSDNHRGANQQWAFRPVGAPRPGGIYRIVPRNAENKVIGCTGGQTGEGTQLVLWDRDGTPNQSWRVEDQGGVYTFTPMHAQDKRLDTNNNSSVTCHIWGAQAGNPNQTFRLDPCGDGYFCLRRINDGAALDVFEGKNQNGAVLKGWPDCHRGPNQQWRFEE